MCLCVSEWFCMWCCCLKMQAVLLTQREWERDGEKLLMLREASHQNSAWVGEEENITLSDFSDSLFYVMRTSFSGLDLICIVSFLMTLLFVSLASSLPLLAAFWQTWTLIYLVETRMTKHTLSLFLWKSETTTHGVKRDYLQCRKTEPLKSVF